MTTWPLAWGPIAADLAQNGGIDLPPEILDALLRVRARADRAMELYRLRYRGAVSAADTPSRIRGFQDTPRAEAELDVGIRYNGDRFAIAINGQALVDDSDDQDYRVDDSMIGLTLGNYALTLNTLDRWWGPGWDGSLILSSNARPVPAFALDRISTEPFETKWLSWLGSWDLAVQFGRMESDRAVPETRFFGMRFNFRPHPSLEIGLSRTAQWCGEGRPCGIDTFVDLVLGRDNRGSEGIETENEPGNQLAGIDLRWSAQGLGAGLAFYGQFIGEDEAGGFPSRYLGQLGVEGTGRFGHRWSYRWFGEFAGTSCQFHESSEIFNCGYNHSIYRTGYRYRGRAVGHGADNDARVLSAGLLLVDTDGAQWNAVARHAALNRGGAPDERNTLTATPRDVVSIDLTHTRGFKYGLFDVGAGFERIDDDLSGETTDEFRAFVRWRSAN